MANTRNTLQKEAVAAALTALHSHHPTADAVCERVHMQYPSISRATVYRILNHMVAEGTALRVPVPGAADRFDDTLSPHNHIRCTACGRVDDLKRTEIPLPVIDSEETGGYTVTGFSLLFEGICPSCTPSPEM